MYAKIVVVSSQHQGDFNDEKTQKKLSMEKVRAECMIHVVCMCQSKVNRPKIENRTEFLIRANISNDLSVCVMPLVMHCILGFQLKSIATAQNEE